MDWTILWWVLSAVLIIVGLAGTVLPALPGVPVIFFGLVLAAWIDGFSTIGWGTLVVLGLLTMLSIIIDLLAAAFGTQRMGASPRAFWGATLGALVGIFFGLVGVVLGPFIGAVAAELSAGVDTRQAGRSGYGAWLGLLLGTAAKLAIAFLMLGIFVLRYVLG
ncbi:MAG: DUF456 domain-containing protein [Oceanisphaera sp.]|nr:DUF456 domain-containing protein [Oceanisphaera sp.]